MAVVIRLKRTGSHKDPHYRVVAADSRMKRDGRFIEQVGHYHPKSNPASVVLEREKCLKWLSNGATPSDTVKSIFRKEGLMAEFHKLKFEKAPAA